MAKHNPVTGGEDEERGYQFTVRYNRRSGVQYRHERIKSIAEKTKKYLKAKYLELNPTDSVEAHMANDDCQVLWDLIGYQRQLIIDADEMAEGEVDWKGVRSKSPDAPFVIDIKDPKDAEKND